MENFSLKIILTVVFISSFIKELINDFPLLFSIISISILIYIIISQKTADEQKTIKPGVLGSYLLSIGLFAFYINYSNAERGSKRLEFLNFAINFFYKNRQEVYRRNNILENLDKNFKIANTISARRVIKEREEPFLKLFERSVPIKNKCIELNKTQIYKACNDLVSFIFWDLDVRIANKSWHFPSPKEYFENEYRRIKDLILLCKENKDLQSYHEMIPLISRLIISPDEVTPGEKNNFTIFYKQIEIYLKAKNRRIPLAKKIQLISSLDKNFVYLMVFDKKFNTSSEVCHETIFSKALQLTATVRPEKENYYLVTSSRNHFSNLITSYFDSKGEEKIFYLNPFSENKYFCIEKFNDDKFEFCAGENL